MKMLTYSSTTTHIGWSLAFWAGAAWEATGDWVATHLRCPLMWLGDTWCQTCLEKSRDWLLYLEQSNEEETIVRTMGGKKKLYFKNNLTLLPLILFSLPNPPPSPIVVPPDSPIPPLQAPGLMGKSRPIGAKYSCTYGEKHLWRETSPSRYKKGI